MILRRSFLSALPFAALAGAAEPGAVVPSETKRFEDPTTEFVVSRLTDPAHAAWLPAFYNSAISRRGQFLLYSSERTGAAQAYRMDLKSGVSRQLTGAKELNAASCTLMPDEHSFYCIDGRSVVQIGLGNQHRHEVYSVPSEYERANALGVTADGLSAAVIEEKSAGSRLRLVNLRNGEAITLAESTDRFSDPIPRPRRAGILYLRGARELWLASFDATENRQLKLAPGKLGNALWSPDGRSVLYLNVPETPGQLNSIREYTPDTNQDRLVAPTSQFVCFNRNADGSVFTGASASKASPTVLLLLRSVRRELTLCEHRSAHPETASPIFSPNSQHVFFQGDRDGKMAIYSLPVERLVEATE